MERWVQLDPHSLGCRWSQQLATESTQILKQWLSSEARGQAIQHIAGGAPAVQKAEEGGLKLAVQIKGFQSESIELDQGRADVVTPFWRHRTEQQIHQSRVAHQQTGLMLRLQLQSFQRCHQQAQQLHFGFDRCDAEQLHTGLEIFLDALSTLIGSPGLEHRS